MATEDAEESLSEGRVPPGSRPAPPSRDREDAAPRQRAHGAAEASTSGGAPLLPVHIAEPMEGVVKFRCDWTEAEPSRSPLLPALIASRDLLHRRGWIGADAAGIGYGNISVRLAADSFLISATQTGAVATTGPGHYVEVVGYEIAVNTLACRGPARASSESLTHAAIYRALPAAGAVVHVHHRAAWERSLGRIPTTRREVPYGTPEMADEVARLAGSEGAGGSQVLAMAGHEEGLIAWGRDLAAAVEALETLWVALGLDT